MLSTVGAFARQGGMLCILLASAFCVRSLGADDRVDFNFQIKPLLSDRCFTCHGPDDKARKGKLRLDLPEAAFKTNSDGSHIIKAGNPEGSELIRRIASSDPDEIMPPPKSNLSLTKDEIELLRRWVKQGAEWKKHWSFIPLSRLAIPEVKNRSWPNNPIDHFVLARLEREGLQPSRPAGKEILARRVAFDLSGLPPSAEWVRSFVGDGHPRAVDVLVDRLLALEAYGERMAADWMDVARYADTYGYQADRFNHLWPWRDWVIGAFNRNLSYDRFILWQIAGDLLPDATDEQKLATAFNRNHRQTNEGGSVEEEFRVEYNADRVHTASAAFLGLTMECARCHDHKYDPISQRDYYRLFAFFNSTDESGLYSHFTDAIPSPTLLLYASASQRRQHTELKGKIAAKEKELAQFPVAPLSSNFPIVARYTFDIVANNRTTNSVSTNFTATLGEAPQLVEGKHGSALRFDGENSVTINNLANFKRVDPFSFTVWLKPSEEQPEIVVLHHQRAGSDAGNRGYELVLENGHAAFALIHFWPGNAMKVRTAEKLPLNEWTHLGIGYDGSSKAAGLQLFINGRLAQTEIVRDQLFKDITYDEAIPLTLAARFRGRGFKGGQLDDLRVFTNALAEAQIEAIYRGASEFQYEEPNAKVAELRNELRKLRVEENGLVNSIKEIMVLGDRRAPRPTHVLKRGMYDAPGETVEPGTPIMPLEAGMPKNRLGLGQWMINPKNPLTARVIVNRYWQMFFGRGIVVTAEDFGSQGDLPSHPELLDWLAQWFIDSGWNLKALAKLITTSATYGQSSVPSAELLARDPENKLLARGPKGRLTAEMLRDGALAASGLLVHAVGGPSVKPWQPEGLWEEKSAGWKYEPDKGPGLYRRSLYTYHKRTSPHPAMTTFDAPERNSCIVRRHPTSTPSQALLLLNNPEMMTAALTIAKRTAPPPDPGGRGSTRAHLDEQLTQIYQLATSRTPTEKELAVLKKLYQEQHDFYRAHLPEAKQLTGEEAPELAAVAIVAKAILNLDSAVLKR